MTDGGSAFRPGQEEASAPVRPRSAFVAHEVFGHGADAVLVEPEVARDLRTAAELARQERRVAGGLLYGRPWADDEGPYLVVDGFLGAGPGENRGDQVPGDGRDDFRLSAADLRLLRADAARLYSAAIEVGWWRSLPGPGEFGARDFESQRELVGPGGVGLLVFGSGLDWGTAYLGPDGRLPGSARSFIPVPRPGDEPTPAPDPTLEIDRVPGDPVPEDTVLEDTVLEDTVPEDTVPAGSLPEDGTAPEDEGAADLEPEPVAAATPAQAGASRKPVLSPAPQPSGPRVISPVRVPAREWGGAKVTTHGNVASSTPTDVKIVVGLLAVVIIVAAIMIGALFSSVLIAVILAAVGLVIGGAVIWASRA